MTSKLKSVFCIVLIFLICLLSGCASKEYDEQERLGSILVPTILKDTYVYDQGQFISDDQEEVINNLLVQLEEKTTIEFAVITIPSLNDLTIEQYAVRLGNKLGIGKADEDNGILLLISKADTKVRLEIGLGLQGFLTDAKCGRILDKFFVPAREKDNYNDACFNTVNAVINAIADSEEYEFSGIEGLNKELKVDSDESITARDILIINLVIIGLIILEFITGYWWGCGFGDGIVFMILEAAIDSRTSGTGRSSGGSFGGGRFNGGGSSR